MPARATWCSARPRALPPTSTSSSLDGSNGFKLSGVAACDRSGLSVASAGDVNGDGFDDLIVGADCADPNGATPARAMWCSARPRALPPTSTSRRLDGSNGFRLSGVAARRSQRLLGRLGRRRQWRRLRRPDRRRHSRRSERQRFRRELCGVRQGLGLCRQSRPFEPRRHQRLPAQRRGGRRLERPLGRLGRRRQRRRLRRPDRRRPRCRPERQRFRRQLCGVRQGARALPPTSTSRRLDGSNGFRLSGAVGADDHVGEAVAVDVAGRGHRPAALSRPPPRR